MQLRLRFAAIAALSLCLVGNAASEEQVAKKKYNLIADQSYKQGGSDYERERCKLDLYLPIGRKEFPVMLWFHGGGLQGGDKAAKSASQVGHRFAAEGIAVASVNYRLSPRVKYPAYIEDAAAALAWVHQNIAKHGGNPKLIFVSGHSAGGYLTAMLATDGRFLKQHGLTTQAVRGALPISGQMDSHSTVRKERGIGDSETVIDESAPIHHANKDAPPLLVICGGNDLLGRAEINERFVEVMKAAGHKNVTLRIVPERNHSSIVGHIGAEDDEVASAMLKFIRAQSQESKPAN